MARRSRVCRRWARGVTPDRLSDGNLTASAVLKKYNVPFSGRGETPLEMPSNPSVNEVRHPARLICGTCPRF